MHNSDLLTYSSVQTRPSYVFTFYMHAYTRRRASSPLGYFGGRTPECSVFKRSAVTFGRPKMGSFVCRRRRSRSLSLCFWVATCHLRPADGAIDCLLRSTEGDSFEASQVADLRLVLLSVRPSPSVPKVSFSVPGVFVGTNTLRARLLSNTGALQTG